MSPESEKALPFEVDASVVFQLGENLISDEVQAVLELIKNAYDADASVVEVTIDAAGETGGKGNLPSIRVSDNGTGMTEGDIRHGWLNISASLKRELKRKGGTTPGGRTPLGDKGLGRLSTQRLGDDLQITTRPRGLRTEYEVSFSWSAFERVEHVGDVSAQMRTRESTRRPGTTLLITRLKSPAYWSTQAARDYLERELSQLLSPYGNVQAFAVGVMLNEQPLNLLRIPTGVKKASELHFGLKFTDTTLTVSGSLRLSFFQPASRAAAEDRSDYANFIAADDGSALRDVLLARPQAADWKLRAPRQGGWYLTFGFSRDLEDVGPHLINGEIARPGPFEGEVDAFEVDSAATQLSSIFGSASELRNYIRDISGVRVYRDGFGIRVDEDWLNLRRQWTAGPSWYSLRPDNTFGYIAISARDNAILEEKTDREGFRINPYYLNFHSILTDFVSQSARLLNFLGRTKVEYVRAQRMAKVPEVAAQSPEEIAAEVGVRLASAAAHEHSLEAASSRLMREVVEAEGMHSDQSAKQLVSAIEQLAEGVRGAQSALDEARQYLAEVGSTSELMKLLRQQIEGLREQLGQMYEMVGLGLTAEALSHEILQVIDQLAHRTAQVRSKLNGEASKSTIAYVGHVDAALGALRKQLAYLAPSLRYVRERRQDIDLGEFLRAFADFHKERLVPAGIVVSVRVASPVMLRVNQGKLTQIFDNLVLNSEYWLGEQARLRPNAERKIVVAARGATVRYSDTGPGIAPAVEHSLFDAFVSTKGRGKGRGLGLFIVRQFLASEGCSIALEATRNGANRLYSFRLDLSGMVKPPGDDS